MTAHNRAALPPTCPVTVWDPHRPLPWNKHCTWPCGQPLVTDLCAHHQAERVRLGGAA